MSLFSHVEIDLGTTRRRFYNHFLKNLYTVLLIRWECEKSIRELKFFPGAFKRISSYRPGVWRSTAVSRALMVIIIGVKINVKSRVQ